MTAPETEPALSPADGDAIERTLTALGTAFAARDAEPLAGSYTADAGWVNAFGVALTGDTQIVEYLRGLFADEKFDAGRPAGPPETDVRVLTPDVVVVWTHQRIRGQQLIGGGEIELRDNRGLHVLQRQPDGVWLIAAEMFTDANEGRTYRPESASNLR